LGTEHLLALVKEDGNGGRVLDEQVAYRGTRIELLDGDSLRPTLCERDVALLRVGSEERKDGQWADVVGLADRDRRLEVTVDAWASGVSSHAP